MAGHLMGRWSESVVWISLEGHIHCVVQSHRHLTSFETNSLHATHQQPVKWVPIVRLMFESVLFIKKFYVNSWKGINNHWSQQTPCNFHFKFFFMLFFFFKFYDFFGIFSPNFFSNHESISVLFQNIIFNWDWVKFRKILFK